MAVEAVLKIKEAEERGKAVIRGAGEEARKIAQSYAANCEEQKNTILVKAKNTREVIIKSAEQKAESECDELQKKGDAEKEKIFNPGAEKVEQAIKFITERIVSV